MRDVQHISQKSTRKPFEILLLLWLLTLPFGSKIGSLSVGFLSVYPSLVFALILFFWGLLSFRNWSKSTKIYAGFLLVWVLYAIIHPKLFSGAYHDNWKFDFRSLGIQFVYAGALIGSYYTLGAQRFFKMLKTGVIYFLAILLVSGVLEYYFGTHLRGTYTDKFFHYFTVTDGFYVPLFIYDNANDYLVYLILVVALLLSLIDSSARNWKALSLFLIIFFFASLASARLAMILVVLLIAGLLLAMLVPHLKKAKWEHLLALGAGVLLIIVVALNNPLFIGPKYTKYNYTSEGVYEHLPRSLPTEGVSSDEVRSNLVLNGIDFIKERPIAGIGPGEFRERHARGKVNYNTGSVIGAHNYPLELVTQYGIIGWAYLLLLGGLFLRSIQRYRRERGNIWPLLTLPILGVCSLMPSGFLYLDIHWFLIPVVLLLTEQPFQGKKEVDE